ncbi:MAG: hypothetical protein AAGK02_12690 [Pseudomonadota bacterium]
MLRQFVLAAGAFALASTPLHAQPSQAGSSTQTDEYLETKREAFAWLIGTWESRYEGDGSFAKARSGAQIKFTMESDGTVIGQIVSTSELMREAKYSEGMYVFRGLERPFTNAPGTSIYAVRTGGGQFRHITNCCDEWRDTLVALHQGDSNLQLLPTAKGSLSGYAEWVKISGPGLATAPIPAANDKCNIAAYNRFLNSEAGKLIDEFDRDTAGFADSDHTSPTSKRHPYVRADFVADEQDEEIRRWEALVREVIDNRGPDDFLRKTRRNVLTEYRDATTKYSAAARADADCPQPSEIAPYTHVMMGRAMGMAVQTRMTETLAEEVAQSGNVQEAYTRMFYEGLGDVGSLEGALGNAAVDAVKAVLFEDEVKPDKVEALVPQLEALRARYAELEAQGNPPDLFQTTKDMKEIFKRAGVDYDPSATSSDLFGAGISGGMSAADLFRSMVLGKTLKPQGKFFGTLSVLFDLAEIGNALLDLKTLVGLNDDVMPVTLAVTEDAAHLAVLEERYRQFYDEFELFADEYDSLVKEAHRRGEI